MDYLVKVGYRNTHPTACKTVTSHTDSTDCCQRVSGHTSHIDACCRFCCYRQETHKTFQLDPAKWPYPILFLQIFSLLQSVLKAIAESQLPHKFTTVFSLHHISTQGKSVAWSLACWTPMHTEKKTLPPYQKHEVSQAVTNLDSKY